MTFCLECEENTYHSVSLMFFFRNEIGAKNMQLKQVFVSRVLQKHTELAIMANANWDILKLSLFMHHFNLGHFNLGHLVKQIEHTYMKFLDLPSNTCLNTSERRASDSNGWGPRFNNHWDNRLLLDVKLVKCDSCLRYWYGRTIISKLEKNLNRQHYTERYSFQDFLYIFIWLYGNCMVVPSVNITCVCFLRSPTCFLCLLFMKFDTMFTKFDTMIFAEWYSQRNSQRNPK